MQDLTCEFSMEVVGGRTLRVARWRWDMESEHLPILFFNGIGANIEAVAPLAEALTERPFIMFDMPGVGGSPAAGRVDFGPLVVSKALDIASPLLLLEVARGTHLPQVTLTVESIGESPVTLAQIVAEDVVLGEYTGSSEEEAQLPGDDLLLTYGRITYTVWPQNPDGSLGEPVTVSWDVERNQAG